MVTTPASSSSSVPFLLSFPSIHNQLTIKLTSSNYLLWKTQLLPILHGHQLFHHVDGTKPPPKEVADVPNPEYQTWYIKDQMVLSWILGSLFEPILSQVVGATTAYVAWSRLQTTYASGSRAQVHTLKNALHALTRDNDSIVTYMDRAKRLFDQLVALDVGISEDDLVDHILRGLGPEYRPFCAKYRRKIDFYFI
ncbi:hypothetical protein K2173_009216 [Erythroxylum novogranatense]|uniref:Retrotransposon Copia-like N-terminal domain-containing protein n=1 Tax=Erythroxylum novogranatense TaxID=1862640 RepID=A0AAV8TIY9_9ROSI|nr:hypothetical protein K2173_009216 [Erythroxylum novogranatense]